MAEATATTQTELRADLDHYWRRLMWYREELWRITIPVWGVFGAFIASCIGYVWSSSGTSRISGDIALMMITVIVLFSWVIHRMYRIYAERIYAAIKDLNGEVQKREQHIYDRFVGQGWKADYGRYRVYPQLDVIFTIIAVAMAMGCIFTVSAAVGFDFSYKPPVVATAPTVAAPALPASEAPKATPPVATPAAPQLSITPLALLGICVALLLLFEGVIWLIRRLETGGPPQACELSGTFTIVSDKNP